MRTRVVDVVAFLAGLILLGIAFFGLRAVLPQMGLPRALSYPVVLVGILGLVDICFFLPDNDSEEWHE